VIVGLIPTIAGRLHVTVATVGLIVTAEVTFGIAAGPSTFIAGPAGPRHLLPGSIVDIRVSAERNADPECRAGED
jgi:predicted MFS family arabinose efflux permease